MAIGRLALLLPLVAACSPPPPWTFTGQGQYTVQLPGTHTRVVTETMSKQYPLGAITGAVHTAEGRRPVELYATAHIDFPRLKEAGTSPLQLLDAMLQGMIGGMQSRVTDSSDFVYEEFVGKECLFSGTWKGQAIHGKARLYLIQERVVAVMVAGRDRACVKDPATYAFFDSFKYNGPR